MAESRTSNVQWDRGHLAKRLLILIGIALPLLVMEAVFRIRIVQQEIGESGLNRSVILSPNPALMWEYRPYAERKYEDASGVAGRPHKVAHFNRWGFRDFDYPTREKPEGVFRVAFVGDSVTEGLGVSDSEVFVRKFEELAQNEFGPDHVQSLNFGVDGYNTIQVSALVQTKVKDYSPDLIIYAFHLNDFDFDDASGGLIDHFRRPRSYVLDWLRKKLRPVRRVDEGYYDYEFRLNGDMVFAELLNLQRFLQQRDIPMVVAVLPIFPENSDHKEYSARSPYPLQEAQARVFHFLDEHGIAKIDLVDPLREQVPDLSQLTDGDSWHPNAAGHRLIAQVLWASTRSRMR